MSLKQLEKTKHSLNKNNNALKWMSNNWISGHRNKEVFSYTWRLLKCQEWNSYINNDLFPPFYIWDTHLSDTKEISMFCVPSLIAFITSSSLVQKTLIPQ